MPAQKSLLIVIHISNETCVSCTLSRLYQVDRFSFVPMENRFYNGYLVVFGYCLIELERMIFTKYGHKQTQLNQ